MRRFVCYRPSPPPEYYEQGTANPPDEPQFEGVVFSDGTVCVRWLTEYRSHSVWASWADLERVHGHPEYGTRIEWLDEQVQAEAMAAGANVGEWDSALHMAPDPDSTLWEQLVWYRVATHVLILNTSERCRRAAAAVGDEAAEAATVNRRPR